MSGSTSVPPLRTDPTRLVLERVCDAVELVERGPRLICETYDAYITEVRKYSRAYAVLTALDAVGTALDPDILPGVKDRGT